MNKIIKMFIVSSLLFFASFHVSANECVEINQNSQYMESLDAACQEQILGIDASVENISSLAFLDSSVSMFDIVLGFYQSIPGMDASVIFALACFGILGLVLIAILVMKFFVGIGQGMIQAANGKNKSSIFTNGFTGANINKMVMKLIPATGWHLLVVGALALSATGLALIVANIQIANYKTNKLTASAYSADVRDKANTKANQDMEIFIDYYTCVLDHDKRVIFDNSIEPDYTFKKSDYLTCMNGDNPALSETKNTLSSRHLYKIQDCGLKTAKLNTASCGDIRFNSDSQQLLKAKLIGLESRFLTLATEISEYYCANQSVVDLDSEIKNYCWKFNPVSYAVPLDGRGRITPITSSKTYSQLKASVDDLKAELSLALQATAIEHFKSYVPPTQKFGYLAYVESKLNENEGIRAVKEYNEAAMNYEIKYIPEFQYAKLESKIKSTNNFILGGTKSVTTHNERINEIVKSLTQQSESQLIKSLVFKFSNFLGRGYVESLGLEYQQGGDYNIVSSTIVAGQEAATYFIATSVALRAGEAGFSLMGTKNFSGKPDLTMVGVEKTLGFFHDVFKNIGFIIAGSVIGLSIMIILSFASQFFAAIQNIVKIGYIYDLAFNIEGIDKEGGSRFNHEDIARRAITLIYIVLVLPVIILEFEISFYVAYVLVDIAKDNFYLINQSAGYITDSGNTLMAVIQQIIMCAIFQVMVIAVMLIAIRKTNESFHVALIQKLYGSNDAKSGLMLEDRRKIQQASESSFSSMGKTARVQRI